MGNEATEIVIIKDREVRRVRRPLTKEEEAALFPYRPYKPWARSRFGGNELYDDVCMLLGKQAKRCPHCGAATQKQYFGVHAQYFDPTLCPDCSGLAEYQGTLTSDGRLQ